jgi:hypothetical protein
MPNVRATVNQVIQIGAESTHGTPVAASKLLSAWDWTFGEKPTTQQWIATGRKYPSASAILTEMAVGKFTGHGDFAALVYPLSCIYGASNPAPALVGASTTVYGWNFKPPISGLAAPTSYTVQQGDSVDAEQYAFLMFSGWGYTFGRKQEVTVSGDWFSQTFSDGISMTSSPTNIALVPMTGAQMNIYLDTTSAGIGATQLTDPLKVDFKASEYYGQYWPINRANTSFGNYIEKRPKNELKIELQANSTAIAVRANYLQTGARAYVQVNGLGPQLDAVHPTNAQFTHNLAAFVSDVSEFKDDEGVYSVEYTLQVAEDTGWAAASAAGTAQTVLLQNLLSAL